MDFLSGYSAVNQGHCHPEILNTLITQATKLTLTSRAFYNDQLGLAEKYICEIFHYNKALFMNSGAEGVESAIKLCRRWAYTEKQIPENEATVLFCEGNFMGRTIALCGASDDPSRYKNFGPFGGLNFELIPYNDPDALEKKLESNKNIAAFVVEPIQGEKGVIIPDKGYLKKIRAITEKHNVLLVFDEIQTGLGRTGLMLCSNYENVRPDMLILGKALSGGFYPISVVLADNNVMNQINPGEHGSTYGGNPLASSLVRKSLEIIISEGMIENSRHKGSDLLNGLKAMARPFIKEIRGKGLFTAMEFDKTYTKTANDFCMELLKKGILAKTTQSNVIRFSPPLIIHQSQLSSALNKIDKTLREF